MGHRVRHYHKPRSQAPGTPATLGPPGTPTLVFSTPPSTTAQSGVNFATDPVVQLQDGSGNNVALAGVTITLAITLPSPTSATLSYAPNPLTTDATGKATVTSLIITGPVGVYQIRASAAGYTSVQQSSIGLSAGSPSPAKFTASVPTSATQNSTVTITIQARDSAGNACTSATNTVVVNINGAQTGSATVTNNNNGTYTATYTTTTVGTDTITIAADGTPITGSPFTLQVSAPSANFPNKPAGLTTIAETNLSTIPTSNLTWTSTGMTSGQVFLYSGTPGSDFLEVSESLANMISPSGAMRTVFPAGFVDGVAPCGMSFWQAGGAGNFGQLYYSFPMRAVGRASDGLFQTHSVNQKLFYVPYADTARSNQSFLFYEPAGTTGSVQFSVKISQMNDNGTDPGGLAADFHPNVATVLVAVGAFAKVEVYMKLNTHTSDPAAHDGIFKMWVNGTLTHFYGPGGRAGTVGSTAVAAGFGPRYVSAANPMGFYRVKWEPVFGGNTGESIQQTQDIDLDHIYIAVA